MFKRLFAVSPILFADLINPVRSEEPRIEVVEVLNSRELADKYIVLDLLAAIVSEKSRTQLTSHPCRTRCGPRY